MKPKKTIIIAGSKGIGKGIYKHLKKISESTIALSSKDFDTSNIENANKFVKKYKSADVLVLNTGGPPPTNFYKISNEEWLYYFNQLFLSFAIILRDFKIKKNGFIFLISSFHIREINPKLVISNSLRIAFWSLLKSLNIFNDLNINLTKLESRPILGRPWEYKFYIDYELSDSSLQNELIERIDLVSKEFKILGHYPKANQE